jgi:hypothetical protein
MFLQLMAARPGVKTNHEQDRRLFFSDNLESWHPTEL